MKQSSNHRPPTDRTKPDHWGLDGRSAYAAIQSTNGTNPDNPQERFPSPRVPWFGFLLFGRATSPKAAGEPTISDGSPARFAAVSAATASPGCLGRVKVWAVVLRAAAGGSGGGSRTGAGKGGGGRHELRIVFLNKVGCVFVFSGDVTGFGGTEAVEEQGANFSKGSEEKANPLLTTANDDPQNPCRVTSTTAM